MARHSHALAPLGPHRQCLEARRYIRLYIQHTYACNPSVRLHPGRAHLLQNDLGIPPLHLDGLLEFHPIKNLPGRPLFAYTVVCVGACGCSWLAG